MTTHLLWFRNDLRLHDHAALADALDGADRLLPLYVVDPRHYRRTRYAFEKTGPHRARFLVESLTDLRERLRGLGSDLIVRQGFPEEVVPDLVGTHGIDAVFAHEEPMSEETAVSDALEGALPNGVSVQYAWGHTLYHLDDLPMDVADLPDVFSSFRRAVEKKSTVRDLIPTPKTLPSLPDGLDAGAIPTVADLGIEPVDNDARAAIDAKGGETAGLDRLDAYLWERDRLKRYKETRNGLLGEDYSSKFSPWLACGCLSPRMIYHEVQRYEHERVKNKSTYWLIFELIWRDFFRFAGVKFGDAFFAASGPLGDEEQVDWREEEELLERWACGTTGFPFIDANMQELNRTGFMSNRGRQNVASFLAHNLGLDWRRGAAYFEKMLIDYDVTSNWGNWAYNAGVGHDPRNRYFNIRSQAERYDEDAAYVKHWLPMLDPLPPKLAHAPYAMSAMEEQMYGVALGEDYPRPIIDLDASYECLRNASRS